MENKELITALGNCVDSCNYCANACLKENHIQDMVDCMRTNHICAEVCSSLHQLLLMEYDDVRELIKYCIKICNDCATECEKHDTEACRNCARDCRKCIELCQQYLG